MMRLAITGGRGRLAPLAARFFADAGLAVRLFSRSEGEGFSGLGQLIESRGMRDFDAILHCAWSTVPFTAEQNPDFAVRQDLPLLERLLAAARKNPVHFVFLSTGAVYGNTTHEPAGENREPLPLGQYARGKLAAENLIQSSGVPATILRVTNLLGESADPARPQGILTRLIEAARTGKEVTLWGDGRATKDYLHCTDFLEALRRILDLRLPGLFNVAGGESVSLLDLVAMVEELAGQPIRRRHDEHFPWDVSFSRIGSEKLQAVSGWRPKYTVREAVESCVARQE